MEATFLHSTQAAPTPWLLLAGLAGVAGAYLWAAIGLRVKGRRWSTWRMVAFLTGMALLAVAFLPQVVGESFTGHAAQHVLIGMLAPVPLALAAPVTLLLATLPKRRRRPVARVLHWPAARMVTHPAAAAALTIGGMYALYLTPLYRAAESHEPLHMLVHVHFFLAGYLFAWSIAGTDPAPGRPGVGLRLVVLLASAAAHAVLAKLMYAHGWPAGTEYLAADLRDGARLMYYGGDIAEVLLAIALLAGWYRGSASRGTPQPSTESAGLVTGG